LNPLQGACVRADVYSNLTNDFGSDGTKLSTFNNQSNGFNCSLTLWGLTINKNSQNALQRYMESLSTTSTSTNSEKPISITAASTAGEVKSIVNSKIQAALLQGSPSSRSASDVAALLGVSKSNLSKAMKLAPAGVKSPKGKIHLSKFNKFISKNPKAAALLTGKSKGKR
jgi:hypothetical protein